MAGQSKWEQHVPHIDLRRGRVHRHPDLQFAPSPGPPALKRGPRVQLRDAQCGQALGRLAEDERGGLRLTDITIVEFWGGVDHLWRAEGLRGPRPAPRYVNIDTVARRRRSTRSGLPLPWACEELGREVGLRDAIAFGCRCGREMRLRRSVLVEAFDSATACGAPTVLLSAGEATVSRAR